VVNTNNMDALGWLRKHLDEDGNDLLREMVREFAERLMAAEVDVLCGAGYGEVSPERVNSRNGYRDRRWDTRAGRIDVALPPRLHPGRMGPLRSWRRAVAVRLWLRAIADRQTKPNRPLRPCIFGIGWFRPGPRTRYATDLSTGTVAAFGW
jgi:hypothetical protein